jgi:hypothetical protein
LISTVEKISTGFWNWSWQFKNDISTNLDNFYAIKSQFISIFIFVSIESLNLDISKSWSRPSRKSRQVLKTGLDTKDVLDLDWSRLSRPPTLTFSRLVCTYRRCLRPIFYFIYLSINYFVLFVSRCYWR